MQEKLAQLKHLTGSSSRSGQENRRMHPSASSMLQFLKFLAGMYGASSIEHKLGCKLADEDSLLMKSRWYAVNVFSNCDDESLGRLQNHITASASEEFERLPSLKRLANIGRGLVETPLTAASKMRRYGKYFVHVRDFKNETDEENALMFIARILSTGKEPSNEYEQNLAHELSVHMGMHNQSGG